MSRPAVDPNETKAAKFVRLANIRAGAALVAIERLGNLGTNEYERTPEQIETLVKALNDAVEAMRQSLALTTAAKSTGRSVL